MFKTLNQLSGSSVTATDGLIGHVKEAFFDDRSWAIRYLVVDAGTWLSGREVLISPYSVKQPLPLEKNINVVLTRQQVKDSPDIDTHQPVSRQHEKQFMGYYAYPEYWYGDGIWGTGQYPILPLYRPNLAEIDAAEAERQRDLDAADVHLRNSAKVTGYDIQASDGSMGHVQDFVFDKASWVIRYVVVDTRNWWPGGKKVLVAKHWIDRIDWETSAVYVSLTREQIKNGPEYDETLAIDRVYEQRLHDAHNRKGYWA
jgi:hypothetical protein